jgi:hypothetical protein
LNVQLMVFTMLKVYENCLKLLRYTRMYIVIKSIKHCILCKITDYIKTFLGYKMISENSTDS